MSPVMRPLMLAAATGETTSIGWAQEVNDEMGLLAIHGFLEIFFAGLLGALLLAVGAFALFLALQLVRNPGRAPRRR